VLCDQLGYPASAEAVRGRITEISRDEHHAICVAGTGGCVIGWVHVYLCLLLEVDLQAEISGLVVDESWRSRGVGRLVLDRAGQWAREHGVCKLNVRSNTVRERAPAFYERAGCVCFKTSRVFPKTLKQVDLCNHSGRLKSSSLGTVPVVATRRVAPMPTLAGST